MNSSFFSSNSAFQKFLLPPKQVKELQIFEQSDLLQNQPKSSIKIEVDKNASLSINSHQKEQAIDEEDYNDLSSEENAKEDISSIAKTLDDHRSAELKKKRKTKKEIASREKDEGRGGNCIASNITKTLLRIIKIKVNNTLWKQFNSFIERYKVKSQKQNTIILLLLLYVFVKKGRIQIPLFDDILGSHFFKSLDESRINCEKKMESEHQRRSFHLKNKKMYNKFIEINTKLFENLKVALETKNNSVLKLEQIEEIISDTYDRKQRQVEKAINKIKSIILNHFQLKELFGYQENDVFKTFYDSVEYAYRRNLPKRSKLTILKANKFIDEFKQFHNLESTREKYFVCFLATKFIGEKENQIWKEFIENFNMKRQFNTIQTQLQSINHFLQIEIPEQFRAIQENDKKRPLQYDDNQCKEQSLDTQQQKINSLYRTYLELANKIYS